MFFKKVDQLRRRVMAINVANKVRKGYLPFSILNTNVQFVFLKMVLL